MINKKEFKILNLSKITENKLGTITLLIVYLVFLFFVYSGKKDIQFIDIPHFEINILPLYLVLIITIVLFLLAMFVKKIKIDSIAIVLIIINVMYIAVLPFTGIGDNFDVSFVTNILFLVFYLFGKNYANDNNFVIKVIRIIFLIICFQAIAEAILGTQSFFGNTYLYKQDFSVPIAASNSLAAKIIPCFAFLLSMEKNKKLNFLYILLALVSVSLTKSRSGVILLIVVFSLVISLKGRLNMKTFVRLLFTTLIFAVLAFFIISDTVIGQYIFSSSDSTVVGRFDLWYEGLSIFWNNPIIGSGIGIEQSLNPHNFIIQILMTSGIVGMSLFVVLWFSIIFKVKKYLNDSFIKACFCFILCMVFQGLVEDVMFTYINGIILWFIIGNMIAREKQLFDNWKYRRKDEDNRIHTSY